MVKNLVFKGGGVLGIAYSGAILELEKAGTLKYIERLAGTSAGSLPACMLAMKMTAKEIFDIVSACDFSTFEDHGNPLNIFENAGYYRGQALDNWITKIVSEKIHPFATFADFKKAGFLDLHIFATNLSTRNIAHFCVDKTPNVIVAEAIRASMSIPMFFEASTLTCDNSIYVDGGCIDNFPLRTFDVNGRNDETLGLFLGSTNTCFEPLTKNEPFKIIKALAETILSSQDINLSMDAYDLSRTIQIDTCGVSATNFKLSTQDMINLFKAGEVAVIKYLNTPCTLNHDCRYCNCKNT